MEGAMGERYEFLREKHGYYDHYTDGFEDAMDYVENAPAVDAVEIGSCDGCYWKEIGRQQRCSCCRRNRHLKDCYEAKV